ncbi:GNAT family N-acetyltransferase [Patescibacteria group bacterium]
MNKIIPIKKNHLKMAAKLHKSAFPGKLLSLFDQQLLEEVYRLLLDLPEIYLLGYFRKNKLIGIIVCTLNTSSSFKKLVLKAISNLHIVIQLFRQIIIHPKIIFQTLSLLVYPSKNLLKENLPEILVIAVDKKYRRQNIGYNLIKNVEKYLRNKQIFRYKVSVESTNHIGQKFYQKMGFKQRLIFSQFTRTWHVLVKKI